MKTNNWEYYVASSIYNNLLIKDHLDIYEYVDKRGCVNIQIHDYESISRFGLRDYHKVCISFPTTSCPGLDLNIFLTYLQYFISNYNFKGPVKNLIRIRVFDDFIELVFKLEYSIYDDVEVIDSYNNQWTFNYRNSNFHFLYHEDSEES